MSRRKLIIIYAALWVIYIPATFAVFPFVNISCVILLLPLVGLGGWWFGRSLALKMTLVSLIQNFFLTGIVYADQVIMYQYIFSGYLVLPLIAFLTGYLRTTHDAIRKLNHLLEERITERNEELSALTDQLLRDSENMKINRGEMLHDGIGQQLTGIQLIGSSLYDQLLNEQDPTSALADYLRTKTSRIHLNIRRISRLLFPIRIGQVGLTAALTELSATIRELKKIHLELHEPEIPLHLEEEVSLQLYRICQETTLHAIDHLGANHLSMHIAEDRDGYRLRLAHNGTVPNKAEPNDPRNLLNYRLNRIAASMDRFIDHAGRTITEVSVPRKPREART